ncbi:MAG: hypothetical protein ABL897_02220 [Hyphomicrobium sp.]
MGRAFSVGVVCGLGVLAGMPLANAGMPRGAMLIADEQDADPATGTTIARGNAEITVEKSRIFGRADVIEVRPAANEIKLKGRAFISVGDEHYQSDAVTCTLDFNTCTNADAMIAKPSILSGANPPVAATTNEALPPALDQPLQAPAGLGADAGVTNPQ